MAAVNGEDLSQTIGNLVHWCDSPHRTVTIEYFVSRYSYPLLDILRKCVGYVVGRAAWWQWSFKGLWFLCLPLRHQYFLQPGPDADTIPRKLEPLPNLYTVPLKDELKESPKHVR
jgi:hypothetical protein